MEAQRSRKAGHWEILGETIAKFEFFKHGWNPYSRFLDVDKVDLILRRTQSGSPVYREVQVKYGKLYDTTSGWQAELFDLSSWRFFRQDEFDAVNANLVIAYVMAKDDEYNGDLFLFSVPEFGELIHAAPRSGDRHKMYISHCRDGSNRWVMRLQDRRFDRVTEETCRDVSSYRRRFEVLEPS
jgi:hypothetical protein